MSRLVAFALLVALVGCGSDDSIVGPDGDCTRGTIAIGQLRAGSLTAGACEGFDGEWSNSAFFYESYTVRLDSGQAYLFTLDSDDFDTMAELIGEGGIRLTYNDDVGDFEGFDQDSELYFVAERSGTFSLRVRGYDDSQVGRYTLTATSCQARPMPNGSVDGALRSSDCVLRQWFAGGEIGERSFVDLYVARLRAGQPRTIRLVATDFTPTFELGGPGFEFFTDGGALIPQPGSRDVQVTFLPKFTGDYLLIVGSHETSATGSYRLTLSNASSARTALPLRVLPAGPALRFDKRRR